MHYQAEVGCLGELDISLILSADQKKNTPKSETRSVAKIEREKNKFVILSDNRNPPNPQPSPRKSPEIHLDQLHDASSATAIDPGN